MDLVKPQRSARRLGVIGGICFVVTVGALIAWFGIDTKSHVLARFKTGNDSFLVVEKVGGKIDMLLASWTVELWWQRSSQWWSCYTLDYEASRWFDVDVRRDDNHVLISKAGKVVGDLNLVEYRLENVRRNTVEYPAFLTNRDPLLNDEGRLRIYHESKHWATAWTEFVGQPEHLLRP